MAHDEPVLQLFVDDSSERIMTVTVRPTYTIDRLKELLVDRKRSLICHHIFFNGKILNDKRTISHYGIVQDATLECVTDEMVKPICVAAKTPTGKVLPISLQPYETIALLKALIRRLSRAPQGLIELKYKATQLEDDEELSYYDIHSNVTVDVESQGEHNVIRSAKNINIPDVLRISRYQSSSGTRFLFSDVNLNFDIRPPSSTAPSYRQFYNGVSSEGVCVNRSCIVYGEKFVCKHGYGVYRVKEDPTKCPECQHPSPRVESFGFSRANIIVRAMPLGLRSQEAHIRRNLKELDGKYKYLPYFEMEEIKEYEFIEVFSCAAVCPITFAGKKVCSVCKRTLVGLEGCNHGQLALENFASPMVTDDWQTIDDWQFFAR